MLFEGRPQVLRGTEQLLLVELQRDGFVKHRAQLAIQAFQQVDPGQCQFQQGFAQLRRDLFGRLRCQQIVDIGAWIVQQFALLADLELVEADVGNLVRQILVQFQAWQGLALFVENLGKQQAALEDADLLVQGRVGLGNAVQQLLGLQVLLPVS